MAGIVPKMAIRFTSFEAYKQLLADKETGAVTSQATFLGTPLEHSTNLNLWKKKQFANMN